MKLPDRPKPMLKTNNMIKKININLDLVFILFLQSTVQCFKYIQKFKFFFPR